MVKRSRHAHPILYGTLVVGTIDLLDAFIFFGVHSGATPGRILQSIASGVYGRNAARMGIHSMGASVLLHYFIAFLIVSIFYALSRAIPFMRTQTLASGIVYGLAAYFVMNYAVIPLSATTRGPFALPVFINGLLIHAFGVGVPSAWFARE